MHVVFSEKESDNKQFWGKYKINEYEICKDI